jgi:hypothetical protein
MDADPPSESEEVTKALESTFGALPQLEVPSRDEWDRDLEIWAPR